MSQKTISHGLYGSLSAALFGLMLSLFVFPAQIVAQDIAQMKRQGIDTVQNGSIAEGVTLLEKVVAATPDDAEANFYLGFGLLAKTKTAKNRQEGIGYLTASKKYLDKAKALGYKSALLDQLLDAFNRNGNKDANFSGNKQANDAMKAGEAAFVEGKLDDAITQYQKALTLDPKLYYAPLFIGDMYVRKNDFEKAEIWYQKAIAIDPNIETAYRYSATPLMKQEKYDLARDRYIEAFISEPFNRLARNGLVEWGNVTKTQLAHPDIKIPANISKSENGNTTITLGIGDDKKDDGSFAWTAYAMSRAVWQNGKDGQLSDKFKRAYPSETKYRHSLAEEMDGLTTLVNLVKQNKGKSSDVKILDPSLQKLIELQEKGLLEAYILLARPDDGIAADYIGYRNKNRDNLRRYIVEYVVARNQ